MNTRNQQAGPRQQPFDYQQPGPSGFQDGPSPRQQPQEARKKGVTVYKPANWVVAILWVAVFALMVVASRPWLVTVGDWIRLGSGNTPLIGFFVTFVSKIWFIGPGLAGLLLLVFEFLGVIGALASYVLVNLCEVGFIGNPTLRLWCFVFDGLVSSLSVVFYGDGIPSLVNDFPTLDADLWNWNGLALWLLTMFGVEAVWAALRILLGIDLGAKK
jgi:hypothetical protein